MIMGVAYIVLCPKCLIRVSPGRYVRFHDRFLSDLDGFPIILFYHDQKGFVKGV